MSICVRRRDFITALASAAAWPVLARAQSEIPVIGFLSSGSPSQHAPFVSAFHKGLLVLGSGDTTLRLCPPLLIDEEQARFAVQTLDTCISEIEKTL